MTLFVCSFVWSSSSDSRIFHSYGDVIKDFVNKLVSNTFAGWCICVRSGYRFKSNYTRFCKQTVLDSIFYSYHSFPIVNGFHFYINLCIGAGFLSLLYRWKFTPSPITKGANLRGLARLIYCFCCACLSSLILTFLWLMTVCVSWSVRIGNTEHICRYRSIFGRRRPNKKGVLRYSGMPK